MNDNELQEKLQELLYSAFWNCFDGRSNDFVEYCMTRDANTKKISPETIEAINELVTYIKITY